MPEKYYILYQWHRDGSKAIVAHGEFDTYEEARKHFESNLHRMNFNEHISLPISALSKEDAIKIAEKGCHWTLP